MIHSIIPNSIIFAGEDSEIDYIETGGIILERENGRVRRIISTNPSDYLRENQEFSELQQIQKL